MGKVEKIKAFVDRQVVKMEQVADADRRAGDRVSLNAHEMALGEFRAVQDYINMVMEGETENVKP